MRSLIFIFITLPVFAQNFPEKPLQTNIKEVTVYVHGAQILRTGEMQLPAGEIIIVAKGLTPHLNDQSIQVKAEGAFTLLAVNHRINYLDDLLGKDQKVDSLKQLIVKIDDDLSLEQAKQKILKETASLLNVNKKLAGENSSVTITQLQQVVKYFETKMTVMAREEIALKKRIKELNEEKSKIQRQLNEWNTRANTPSSEIAIRVRTQRATRGRFNISYVARNAGWTPQYDIRVSDIESPVELSYKAEVYQNTGVDWNNVKLSFSNGNPNQSGTAPQLTAWYLDFYQEYVTFERRRVMAAPSMEEAPAEMAAGFGMEDEEEDFFDADLVSTTTVENTTTVQFEVDIPYSVQSNGDRFSIDLSQHSIEASYEYYAIPKLDRDAFLIARIVDWNQLNLLSGRANLYFEDAYVGKSYLNAGNVSDTLDLSLGRDKGIVLIRKKSDQFSKTRTIGSNRTESRGFEISVRNTKSQPVSLTIFDQIPVSTNSEITVETVELSGGQLNRQSGEVTWKMDIGPRESKDLSLQYEVKYPKKRKVILE